MKEELIRAIVESPNGLEAFNSWILLEWARFSLGLGAVIMLFVMLWHFIQYIKNDS